MQTSSVTRLLNYLLNIWPFTIIKFCPIALKFTNLSSLLNKLSKNCQRILKKFQSGEISPNLVPLIPTFRRLIRYWKFRRLWFSGRQSCQWCCWCILWLRQTADIRQVITILARFLLDNCFKSKLNYNAFYLGHKQLVLYP